MTHFLKTFAVVGMQTCTPEWRTSFLREVAPALSKNVCIYIGVIGMHGKAMETRKPVILTTNIKQKTHYQITFEKKSSTLIRQKCIWHLLAS